MTKTTWPTKAKILFSDPLQMFSDPCSRPLKITVPFSKMHSKKSTLYTSVSARFCSHASFYENHNEVGTSINRTIFASFFPWELRVYKQKFTILIYHLTFLFKFHRNSNNPLVKEIHCRTLTSLLKMWKAGMSSDVLSLPGMLF